MRTTTGKRKNTGKTLVIVESPTKARTISRFLGKKYIVESSFGHVRDLPSSSLGIDTENDFEPKYLIPRKKSKAVKELRSAAKKSDEIILATDEDREGEAIAWHLLKALNIEDESQTKRIVFHEITKQAIEEALQNPRSIDMMRVDAQQARRILDRLVGYKLSPFLWKKVMRGLSAGRVQSVALRLIVEREREREQFKKEEYWTINATFQTKEQESYEASLVAIGGKTLDKFDIGNEKSAKDIVKQLKKDSWRISRVEKKEVSRAPLPPFITSTLQQQASRVLNFSAKQTMMFAQQLYEGVELSEGSVGLITYMRTDSTNLSDESRKAAKEFLTQTFGKEYAMETPRIFRKKSKGAQEAHEAIRPTDVWRTPESLKPYLDAKQAKLYELIWRRFTASQMPNAALQATTIDTKSDNAVFRSTGQTVIFDGFMKVWKLKTEENILPAVNEDDPASLSDIENIQHFTEPPARYSEATLVKTLEKNGIGRPSTYAPIMSTIVERGYVAKDQDRRFYPTEIGLTVNDILVEHFPSVVDINFTAKMEEELDLVAEGKMQWQPVIKDFYGPFSENLEKKYDSVEKKDMSEPTDETCEKCGKPMVIRHGRFGKFIACSGFPECRNTKTMPPKSLNIKCEECNEGELVERRTRKRRVFYGCSRYPDCTFATWKLPNNQKKDE